MQALDRLDANDAFKLGFMRQKWRPGDIANCVESRHIGLAHAIEDAGAAVGLHAELLQAEVFDIADDTDRGDNPIDGESLRAALAVIGHRGDAVRLFIELCHLGAGKDLDALLFEALARKSRDLSILNGQDLRQHLDHSHLGAERAVERRELDSNCA